MITELKVIENELVPVYETDKGEKVVYGTELYAILSVKSRFNDWVRNRLNDCEALENEDYEAFTKNLVSGGQSKEYVIRLDTAKEMAMLEKNDIGKQVRKYFIEVDKKHKQAEMNLSELTPELQMFNKLFTSVAHQQLEQKRQAEQLNRIEEKQNTFFETLRKEVTDDFKTWCRKCITKIVESPNCTLDVPKKDKYGLVWNESYDRLHQKRPCRLKQRVDTARGEALRNGATQSKVKEICALTIIANDKDLRPVYELVLKEMMIAYCVEVA